MIHLHYSNRTEALFEQFARDLDRRRQSGASPLEPVRLVVPNRNVETWLKRAFARRDGIAANFEVLQLRRFIAGLLAAGGPSLRLADSELLFDSLLGVLLDERKLASPGLARVRTYLRSGGDSADAVDLRRVQLATELSRLFEEYGFSRPEMLAAWTKGTTLPKGLFGETEQWQRELWLSILGPGGVLEERSKRTGERYLTPAQALKELGGRGLSGGVPVYLFGVSYVARLFQSILAALAREGELFVYTLNPCMEFWEDLSAGRETRRALPKRAERLGAAALESEDPFGLLDAADTPALSLWGRPGRENIRLLNEVADCDFHECFADPGQQTLLRQLQRDILMREPERTPEIGRLALSDASIQVLACPGGQREAEAIAAEIWSLIERDEANPGAEPLRFTDIAVLVAGSEPQATFSRLAAAFEQRGFSIPYTLEETALGAHSAVVEAAELLLALPLGRFTRAEVLKLATHPCVISRYPDADPQQWVRTVDALGIFHGLDREDHAGSYLERDLHNWDQGLRRLALGEAVSAADGEEVAIGGERYLPPARGEVESAEQLGLLLRSLLADARFARDRRLTMAEWSEFLSKMLSAYVEPRGDGEESELERCLRTVRSLGELELGGEAVSYRVACELARTALGSLKVGRSRQSDEGVVISTLQPMRAIPFRVIFVAGLGEGRFPSADRRNFLDLRLAKLRAGDVSGREQDQYMFLETLLSARERLYLSYVGRDELTGDALEPSSVVAELVRMLRRGYLAEGTELVRKASLRRFDPELFPDLRGEPRILPAPPEARAEAQLALLRRSFEQQQGAVRLEPERIQKLVGPEKAEAVDRLLRRLSPPVAAPDSGTERTVRISLGQLRKFLDCPLQGAARFLLRLAEDEEDRAEIEDELFESDRLGAAMLERPAFFEAIQQGGDFEPQLRRLAEPLVARGAMPAGLFLEAQLPAHRERLRVWNEGLAAALPGESPRFERVRFGGADDRSEADAVLDPIRFELGPVKVEIFGRTGPLALRGSVEVSVSGRNLGSGAAEEARRNQESLGAFLDHVALSASGRGAKAFKSVQLYDGDFAAVQFDAISPAQAVDYLRGLCSELLSRPHDYLLPAEAVLAWRDAQTETYLGALQLVTARGRAIASSYGPVREALDYPPAGESAAADMAQARLGLFFEKRMREVPAAPEKPAQAARGKRKEAKR